MPVILAANNCYCTVFKDFDHEICCCLKTDLKARCSLSLQEMSDSFKNLISTFLWPDIGKLHFEV